MNMLQQCDCGAPTSSQRSKLKKQDGVVVIGRKYSSGYKVCSCPGDESRFR